MGPLRRALLAGSQRTWLRQRVMHSALMRRSVSRFMPGERLEDALTAATQLQSSGIATIFTRLGANITAPSEARDFTDHDCDAMRVIAGRELDPWYMRLAERPANVLFVLRSLVHG